MENQRLTAEDAKAQVNLGLTGSLIVSDESGLYTERLTPANLDYLYALRRHILEWSDAVQREIAVVEHIAAAQKELV